MARQQQPQTEPTQAALTEHIAALLANNKQLREEQLAYEAKATHPEEPKPGTSLAARITHFLNGLASDHLVTTSAAERLHAIVLDRAAIKQAISQLELQRIQALGVEYSRAAEADTPEFLAAIRDAMTAEERLKAAEVGSRPSSRGRTARCCRMSSTGPARSSERTGRTIRRAASYTRW